MTKINYNSAEGALNYNTTDKAVCTNACCVDILTSNDIMVYPYGLVNCPGGDRATFYNNRIHFCDTYTNPPFTCGFQGVWRAIHLNNRLLISKGLTGDTHSISRDVPPDCSYDIFSHVKTTDVCGPTTFDNENSCDAGDSCEGGFMKLQEWKDFNAMRFCDELNPIPENSFDSGAIGFGNLNRDITINGNRLAVAVGSGVAFYNKITFELLWSSNYGDTVESVAIDDDFNVYAVGHKTFENVNVRKYNSSGVEQWNKVLPETVTKGLLIGDDGVYVSRLQFIYKLSLDEGNIIWTADVGEFPISNEGVLELAFDKDGNILGVGHLNNASDNIWIIDKDDGTVLSSDGTTGEDLFCVGIDESDDYNFYVGAISSTVADNIWKFDSDRNLQWGFPIGNTVIRTCRAHNKNVYVGGNQLFYTPASGDFYGYREAWKINSEGTFIWALDLNSGEAIQQVDTYRIIVDGEDMYWAGEKVTF